MASTYAALLRGINVGGKAKVDMPILRAEFEARHPMTGLGGSFMHHLSFPPKPHVRTTRLPHSTHEAGDDGQRAGACSAPVRAT